MGSFLQTISQLHQQQPSLFFQKLSSVSQPIDNIKQLYGLFKSVCDSFLITKQKYLEIFQSSKNLAEIWDKQQTNKLDALELFTGLIMHSVGTFKQKLKFLFIIFDFNQIRNLSFVDLQYATLCICNATFKILGKNAKANQSEIVSWLKTYFDQSQRINITKLYAFCIQSPEVKRFFQTITKQSQQAEVLKEFQQQHDTNESYLDGDERVNLNKIPSFKESKKQLEEKLEWHRQFSKKLAVPYNPTNYLHRSQMSWVYGLRVSGLRKPFILIQKSREKGELQLVYTTSTLMVLYNIKTNKQRYYGGHSKLVSSFVYNQSKSIVISASKHASQRAIHIWSYETLECKKIIDLYKPVRQLSLLGKNEEKLIVICDYNSNRGNILNKKTQQFSLSTQTTIMIFSLAQFDKNSRNPKEQNNFPLLYSYSYDSVRVDHIANVYTVVDSQEVGIKNIWDCFVAVCSNKQAVVFSQVENKVLTYLQITSKPQQNNAQKTIFETTNTVMKTLFYDYYEEQSDSQNQTNSQRSSYLHDSNQDNKITCCITLYMNDQNPALRTLINSDESMSLFIITGHRNGQVKCLIYNDGQFGSEQILFDCQQTNYGLKQGKPNSSKRVTETYKIQPQLGYNNQQERQKGFPNNKNSSHYQLEAKPITCIHHTDTHILFSHASTIIIFPFSYLTSKDQSLIRTINLMDYPHLKLFNPNIQYFTCTNDQIVAFTEKQGDFVHINDRKIVFNSELAFAEVQCITRIKTLTKIDNRNHSQSMCLLEKPQSSAPLLYLTTQDTRILIINTFTKEVQNVWEINSPKDKITVIDAVYTDEDVLYFVCGCQSGKLYIRIDNQQNPKFYDCSSQIIDIKISKDASYLLVSTIQKYLFFFTQINKNFSSPRKLHFQNEIPVCINFLDSNKMFTVNTSAKNVYVIEIPQLKHRNIQKQSQRISISKMKIMYPSTKGSYESIFGSNGPVSFSGSSKKQASKFTLANSLQRHNVYTKSYLGGELKYFLITLNSGELMFFESRQHLTNFSYVTLSGHCGEIANLVITQDQQKFYTLGRYDNSLIEWQAKSIHTIINVPQSVRSLGDRSSMFEIQQFQKMKEMSCYYKLLTSSRNDDIYLFKGTKNQKLNQSLRKSLQYLNANSIKSESIDEISEDNQNKNEKIETSQGLKPYMPKYKLNLRQPNLSLEMSQIYGLECYKRSSVAFWGDDQQNLKILYFTSRFLLSLDVSAYKRQQKVVQEQKHKLSCFAITDDNKILYALAEPNTKIRFHGKDDVLWTSHEIGIIHLTVYKCFVLSYGILSNFSYSVNLHNYKTGQLLSKRTTQAKIHEFIFINENQFISLNQIRIWKDMYPSEKIGKATSGILMPNLTDVCLGTDNGSISILNKRKGIFTVVTKAHQSDIICITINKLQMNGFEILTVSKDDRIKIWNQNFNCKLLINLRDQLLKNIKYLPQTDQDRKNQGYQTDRIQNLTKQFGKPNIHHYKSLNIRGIDSREGRVLIYLASGQVYIGRFTLINRQNILQRSGMQENSQIRDSQDDDMREASRESIEMEVQKNARRNDHNEYEKQWEKIIESHCCETQSIFKKSVVFGIHPSLPIIASVGKNDKKLLFRNYETSQVVDTFFSEESRITCLKFSKKGHLLILGFLNGNVKIYSFDVKQKEGSIKHVDLKFSQKFSIKEEIVCEAINIEVSQRSIYFAVSFVGHNIRGDSDQKQSSQRGESNEPQNRQSFGFVNIYKLKSQKSFSSQSSSYEQTYYSLIDTLRIRQIDSSLFSTGKYIRCVYDMDFLTLKEAQAGFNKSQNKESTQNNNKKSQKLLKTQKQSSDSPLTGGSQLSPFPQVICLVMYQQYINENMIKVNNSQRDKFSVYSIQQRTFSKRQFEEINWQNVRFSPLVNVIQLNRFMSEIMLLGEGKDYNKINFNGQQNYAEQEINQSKNTTAFNANQQDIPLTITSMCYLKNSVIVYGGSNGKLHLVRKSSLLTQANETLSQLKQQQMSTCKTYPCQASFITRIQHSNDRKYLFVSGQLDESIIKYNVIDFKPQSQLDYQEYDTYRAQLPQIYITKQKFYNFINSLSPLRQGIRNVLEDVEGFDSSQRIKNNSDIGLQTIKVIGRRAYDRMNNLFAHQQHLIYTLGPNLILQSILDPFTQKLLPSDPSPLSHNPQISTIHMKKNTNILILATQQQCARLFIWDIRAMICLSQMEVNCSIIYGLRLIGNRYAVFYGINSMYQLVIQVVDWKLKRVVALCNLLHSAVWKIRDICVLQNQSQNIDQNNIRFVTCGAQHLSEWSMKSNTLIEKHFSNSPSGTIFTVISHIECNLILTGCEKGNIYIWKNLSLLQQLKVHSGPVRSIEVISKISTVLTGGMDSVLCILKFQDDELYVQSSKSLNPKSEDIYNTSNVDESSRGEREKELMPSQLQQGSFLTEFDIQSIIHTSIGFTSSNHETPISDECTFFAGTRSGDIYFCEYNMRQKEFISTTHLVYGQDHQTIVSCAFANKQQVLYTLTTSGKLQVWELKQMQKVFSYKFMKRAKRLYIYREYISICFQKQIIFIELDIRDKIIKIDETLTLVFDGLISQCTLSFSQNYLGVGLHGNETNEILIYDLSKKNLLYRSPSLKYEIQFLDFSTDQKYLLYKDKFQEIGMVYLVTLKRINTIFVEMKLQWQTQGLRISPKAQRIYCSYNCENRITTIAKLASNYILVGDEMGTLRLFQYPPDSERLGELHSHCYTQHMNKINCIKQHRELTYIVTTAVGDRSLILWRKIGMT